jgi:hypothetical protein
MSEMRERVAAAICIKRQIRAYGRILTLWRAPEMSATFIEGILDDAEAAILAMREPSEAMVGAAEDTGIGGTADDGTAEDMRYDPEMVWRAMIDEAMK